MKKYLLHIVIFLCFTQLFYSQEDGVVALDLPIRNSLKFNRYVINPTFSYVREQNKYVSFSNKREWVQFDDAAQTYLFSLAGRFNENIGAGVGLFQQNYGVLTTFGGIVNFAYNAVLDRDSNLTFGMNLAFYKSGINEGNVVTNFPDPSLDDIPSNSIIAINPGINYGTMFFDFGVSINNLVAYNLKTNKLIEENPEQNIQAHIMYTGYMNSRGFFDNSKFSGLVRSEFKKDQTIVSGIMMLVIPKGLWGQVGYNSLYGVSGGIGLNITKQISLEYNYEKSIGDLATFGSSHEVTLAYKFNRNYRYNYSDYDDEGALINPDNRTAKRYIAKSKTSGKSDEYFRANRIAKAQAKEEAQAKAEAEKEVQAKLDQEIKAKADEEARIKQEQEALAKAEEEAKAQAVEEARIKLEQETQAKQEAEAKAKAEQDAKRLADLAKARAEEAARIKQEQEAQRKQEAEAKAKEEARIKQEQEALAKAEEEAKIKREQDALAKAEEEARAKAEEDAKAKAEEEKIGLQELDGVLVPVAKDVTARSMESLTKLTTDAKVEQQDLLARLGETVAVKQQDLDDLKEENDLSEQGIYKEPKPFKSVTAENAALEALKSDIDNAINAQDEKISQLERLYNERLKNVPNKRDSINAFYLNTIQRLKSEQLQIANKKEALLSSLEDIKIATEIERKRRIKRAAYDNEQDRYLKDRATLNAIKQNTPQSSIPLKEEDFDFGEEQGNNIRIVKDVTNAENGYYLVLAVHSDVKKRDDFVTKAVSSGQYNIDFFFDVNSSNYFIYYEKFDDIESARRALEAKGSKPYNSKMSIVKIED